MLASWPDYRLFPYERRLAELEARSLGAQVECQNDSGLELSCADVALLTDRSTYFASLRTREIEIPTAQAQVEAIHLNGNGRAHQATRYGPHGFHEYKGKFNPQIVRAFVNIVDTEADLLVDPFCGSGTALVEALRLGMGAFGLDSSPIASFVSRTKVDVVTSRRPSLLRRRLMALVDDVASSMKDAQDAANPAPLTAVLSEEAVSYLQHWFTEPAFAALSQGLGALLPRRRSVAGRLALVALSSILRDVSLQLPEDLRIRRRPAGFVAPPLWELFYEACYNIDRAIGQVAEWPTGGNASARVILGSVTSRDDLAPMRDARRRLVVTSPPYAMALPYIDTDRLSLVALGLASPTEVRLLERQLIGSREWLRSEANSWNDRLATNADGLPNSVVDLALEIARRNAESGDAGFRKAAVPGLVYRYFAQMGEGLKNLASYQTTDENAVFIVGSNRTTAGGETLVIPTPLLLADVAESSGYTLDALHELDTWPRYGLHHANSVQAEQAVVLRRRSS